MRPAENLAPLSTAGCARMVVEHEIRPVIAQLVTVAQTTVSASQEPRELRTRELDGLAGPLPWIQAAVRHGQGEWQPRPVTPQGVEDERFVAVQFTDGDRHEASEVAVTAWVPPSDLNAVTDPFVVPADGRLRFGIALRSAVPSRATYRVSVEVEGQTPEPLYAHQTDNMSAVAQAWRDIELSLSKYAGREVRLRFQASPTTGMRFQDAPFAPPKPLVSAPVIVTPEARDEQRRNVILISIDTLRADHLGAYGYHRPVSPTIDRLATHGVLFENVIAQWPETSASHMTMFTGLYPSVHGIGIVKWGAAVLPPWQLTVAEVFRRAGFVTGAITEDGLVLVGAGFPRGFEQYREFPLRTADGLDATRNPVDQFPVARGHLGEAKRVFATGAAWVRQHQRDRFFLFLHTYQVHQRSAPGERYAALRASFVGDHVAPAITDAQSFVATYDAAIAYTDDALNELLHALDEIDLARRTLVVITSDHGEEFYEHGAFGHGETLYDPALRVPLIFYAPGFIAAGKRISTQLGLIDLAPTMLDLLRLPPLKQFQGHSAAGLINGEADDGRGPAISELADTWRAVRTNSSKLIRIATKDTPRVEFYDLGQDPGETKHLDVEDNPSAIKALQVLTQHDLECRSLRDQLQAASASHVATRAADLDEQTRERLEALGYKVPPSR